MLNAAAAFIVCLNLGANQNIIKKSLKNFSGVERRMTKIFSKNNNDFYDDYAHHPTEVEATLKAAKNGWDRRVIAVFQPHLFTRTQEFFREFAQALQLADLVIITDIYPAREQPIPGVTAKLIVDECQKAMGENCIYLADLDELETILDPIVNPNDLILTMGAGSIWRYSESYTSHLASQTLGVEA